MVMKHYLALEERRVTPLSSNNLPTRIISQEESYAKLHSTDAQSTGLCKALQDAAGAAVALEAMAHYLSTSIKGQELGASGSQFVNIAVESICLEAHVDPGPNVFSLEQYKRDPQLALEGALSEIGQKIKNVWKFIKEKLVAFFKLLAEKMDYFKSNMGKLERQLKSAEGRLAVTDKNSVVKMNVLKPSYWFIDLIYLDKGFPKYAQGISADLDELLSAHSGVFKNIIAKQIDWLKANHVKAASDESVLDSFKVKTSDFLMLEAKPMDRSVREHIPTEGNMFYRSRELPGGKAIFTDIDPHDRAGPMAIDMLSKIRVAIDEYDPVSYDLRTLEIARQAQADLDTWYDALPPETRQEIDIPSVNYDMAKIPGTGRELRISKALIFETLPLEQIALRLEEVKNNLKSIREWYDVVFGEIWKDRDFDYLADNLIEASSTTRFSQGGYVNPGPRHLGNLVLALLKVMANATDNTHTYAFKTCGSLLNYAEESLKQYRPS